MDIAGRNCGAPGSDTKMLVGNADCNTAVLIGIRPVGS